MIYGVYDIALPNYCWF